MPIVSESLSVTDAEQAKFLDVVVSTDAKEALAVVDSAPDLKSALIKLDKEDEEVIGLEDLTLSEARAYHVGFVPSSRFRVSGDVRVDAALGIFNQFKGLNYNVAVESGGKTLVYLAESKNESPAFYEAGVSGPFLETQK